MNKRDAILMFRAGEAAGDIQAMRTAFDALLNICTISDFRMLMLMAEAESDDYHRIGDLIELGRETEQRKIEDMRKTVYS